MFYKYLKVEDFFENTAMYYMSNPVSKNQTSQIYTIGKASGKY
jgi:hypothetical protein